MLAFVSEPKHERDAGSTTTVAIIFAVVMPILYVLSVGPVALACDKLDLPNAPAKAFYAPLIWLHDHTLLKKPLEAYLSLWGVK